jgi:subtilisin-like proprotein convertase family protein
MKIMKAFAYFISPLLSLILCSAGLCLPVQAQQRIIVINADQPNIWTLEQAHYLLAQMHRRNLDLRAKSLDDLDPNEINGLRFDVMRMLVEFGATFNQADLATNRMFTQNQEFNSQRRQELTAEADELRKQSLALTGEIDELETKKADAESEEEKGRLDAKIASKKNRQAKVDKELENVNGELKTLNVAGGELKATTGAAEFDASKLPKSVFDKAFEAAASSQIERFNEAPQLNASLRLDNFLQMQYEIIAKQLTLLRDELGPGERLLFLEMPQTINVAHHEADKKWAQSWWKIAGYTRRERYAEHVEVATPKRSDGRKENEAPIKTFEDVNSVLRGDPIGVGAIEPRPCNPTPSVTKTDTNAIQIVDGPTSAEPHPLSATVNMPGTITNVTVQIRGLRHERPEDLDMLLVGPQGQNALIWSDVGDGTPADDVTITLDQGAAVALPNAAPLISGTYQPANYGAAPDQFPKGTPPVLGGSSLSVFNGTNPNGTWKLYLIDDYGNVTGSISQGWTLNITTAVDCTPPTPPAHYEDQYRDRFIELPDTANVVDGNLRTYLDDSRADVTNRAVRTVELIPRQSSLNVNDMNLQVRAGALNFVLSTLIGFGSQLKVQRQREQFAQFVQQELYSSAFGKGSREFGWTFTPMPGMDRLQSGVRTTYAVVVVPDDATSLVLEANGCYFPRSEYQPLNFADTKTATWNVDNRTSRNCGGQRSKAFIVPIPTARIEGTNDFWVNRIDYQPVGKGKQIVVLITGENFSSQIGVLINGVPLRHSIGLAQPLIRDDSRAGRLTEDDFKNSEITGHIERVDPNKIVFSFKMPDDYEGTPTITLVAPGKAIDLNWLTNIHINEIDGFATLSDRSKNVCKNGNTLNCITVAESMFAGDPVRPFRIDKVEAFRNLRRNMNVLINGAGFKTVQKVFINGFDRTTDATVVSPTLISAPNIPAPFDDNIQVTLVADDKTLNASAVVNPLQLVIDKVTVISYEEASKGKAGVLVVRIEGRGFTPGLQLAPRKIRLSVTSTTEAFLTIPNPRQTEVVTLRDPVTNVSVSTVIGRKPTQ